MTRRMLNAGTPFLESEKKPDPKSLDLNKEPRKNKTWSLKAQSEKWSARGMRSRPRWTSLKIDSKNRTGPSKTNRKLLINLSEITKSKTKITESF